MPSFAKELGKIHNPLVYDALKLAISTSFSLGAKHLTSRIHRYIQTKYPVETARDKGDVIKTVEELRKRKQQNMPFVNEQAHVAASLVNKAVKKYKKVRVREVINPLIKEDAESPLSSAVVISEFKNISANFTRNLLRRTASQIDEHIKEYRTEIARDLKLARARNPKLTRRMWLKKTSYYKKLK